MMEVKKFDERYYITNDNDFNISPTSMTEISNNRENISIKNEYQIFKEYQHFQEDGTLEIYK